MAVVSAEGIHVRHAINRALATHNRTAADATWRLLKARVEIDARGRLTGASVAVQVEPALPAEALQAAAWPAPGRDSPLLGLVNPDGLHPLMAAVPGHPGVLLDVIPVTWDRWARLHPGAAPPTVDPWCPRTGVSLAEAEGYARAVQKRLPTRAEVAAAWGPLAYPWGDRPDPRLGHAAPPRYGAVHEVATLPPSRGGHYDLGAWLAQWTADGDLVGIEPHGLPGPAGEAGAGFRCAAAV